MSNVTIQAQCQIVPKRSSKMSTPCLERRNFKKINCITCSLSSTYLFLKRIIVDVLLFEPICFIRGTDMGDIRKKRIFEFTLKSLLDRQENFSRNTVQEDSSSSVSQSCPTLCDPMDCSKPGFSIHHQLPEFTQTQVN